MSNKKMNFFPNPFIISENCEVCYKTATVYRFFFSLLFKDLQGIVFSNKSVHSVSQRFPFIKTWYYYFMMNHLITD